MHFTLKEYLLIPLNNKKNSQLLQIGNTIDMKTEVKWQIPINQPGDFITNIRYEKSNDGFILIHEKPKLSVTYRIENLSDFQQQRQENIVLNFQSNIYDSLFVENSLIVSNRNMPVRLYSLLKNEQNKRSIQWISFNDKKPNSELYLFPLQFAKYNEVILGGGKKFMSQYDCVKFCVSRRVKQMNKRFISAVQLINNSLVVAGQFDGQLSFFDLRTQQKCYSMKPHFDLVTRIKRVPLNQNQIVSMARKDNFIYLWDHRKLQTFVNCYEQQMYGNQRTGLDITNDGQNIILGTENGSINIKNMASKQLSLQYNTNTPKCISSLCSLENTIVYAVGERDFPLDKSEAKSGFLGCLFIQ